MKFVGRPLNDGIDSRRAWGSNEHLHVGPVDKGEVDSTSDIGRGQDQDVWVVFEQVELG